MAAECGFCAVFKDRGEAIRRPPRACADAIFLAAALPAADAGLSKLNSMLALFADDAVALRVDGARWDDGIRPARFGRRARPNRSPTGRPVAALEEPRA
jgi:hypothetical protein